MNRIKAFIKSHKQLYIICKRLYKFFTRTGKQISESSNQVSQIYAAGYSFSRYLTDRGISNISVYCEKEDYLSFGHQICLDLWLSHNVVVTNWLSNKEWNSPKQRPHLIRHLRFLFLQNVILQEGILFILSNPSKSIIKQMNINSNIKIIFLNDILNDAWFQALQGMYLDEVQKNNPFLPIITTIYPLFPRNKEHRTDIEKYICEEKVSLNTIKNDIDCYATVPKTLEAFNYRPSEILDMINVSSTIIQKNMLFMEDRHGDKVNIINGHRITPGQNNARSSIYIFGPCNVYGIGCPDAGTVSAHLQNILINNNILTYSVENYGMCLKARGTYIFETMKKISYKQGDLLFYVSPTHYNEFIGVTHASKNMYKIDITHLFERPHDYGEVFIDKGHINENGQKVIANELFRFLQEHNFFICSSDPPIGKHCICKARAA